jgi:catechol-2,3-dioxygenase
MQGLGVIAAGSATVSAAEAQSVAIKGVRIDHVSIQVTDLPRAVEFYKKVFGFSVVSEDKRVQIV